MASDSDIVLGLFPTEYPEKSDMVDYDASGTVRNLQIKPEKTSLHLTWTTAVWRPTFTEFMHNYLAAEEQYFRADPYRSEPYVGTVINAAIKQGLIVSSSSIENATMLDIGTPDSLTLARSGKFFKKPE